MISNEERRKWMMHLMNYFGRYHNHKETMAWLATAFFIGGIISFAFASRLVVDGHCTRQTIICVLIVLAGVWALCFVLWQFSKRGVAGDNVLNIGKRLNSAYDTSQLFKFDDPTTGWISVLLSCLAIAGATAVAIFIVCAQ